MAAYPLRLELTINYGMGNKKTFFTVWHDETYGVIGLLFPSDHPNHTDEIPEPRTLTEALEGAEGWSWDLSPS